MPFAAASEDLAALTLVEVSPKSVERIVHQYGTALGAVQQEQAQVLWDGKQELPVPAPAARPAQRAVSVDGTMIHIRQQGWKEVKIGTVFDFTTELDAQAPEGYQVKAESISYCGHVGSAAEFEPLFWKEMERREVRWAATAIAISDAGLWVRNLLQAALPEGQHIVDWYHACERVWGVANAVFGLGSIAAASWGEQVETHLWHGEVACVLAALQQLQAAGYTTEALGAAITYFTNHADLMDYAAYRRQGYPIGSGTTESACKQLVAARCKLSGMHWSLPGAQAVLALRVALLSHTWESSWTLARDRVLNPPLK